MTVLDLLNPVAADLTLVAADQMKLASDQQQLSVDDATFVAAMSAAGVPSFSVVSGDGSFVSTYTMAPGATPPYTVVNTPTAGSITIPAAGVPAVPAAGP